MKRIYLLIILVVGCVMLSAQQDPFTNRIPCHLKASRVGTNSVELIWENVVEAVSYEVYKEDTLYKTVKENRITVEGLNSFDIYFFSVKARNSHGEFSRESEKLYVATAETKRQKDKRMAWWREARFGMFVHWGPYSALGGHYTGPTFLQTNEKHPWIEADGMIKDYYSCYRPEWVSSDGSIKTDPTTGKPYKRGQYAEWIMFAAQIPRDEYLKRAKEDFKAEKFDAKEWVRMAKEAGMKYIVITSKHHDGIALLNTPVGHTIFKDTDIRRDILKELVNEARKAGLKIGFYYSQALDWNNPGGMGWIPQNDAPNREASYADKAKYTDEIVIPHLHTIINDYKVDLIWWDMGASSASEFKYRMMKAIKNIPGTERLIFNDRMEDKLTGDFKTPEQSIPDMPSNGDGTDWETCMTLNDNWGYAAHDIRWKTTEDVLQKLIDITSKGGNYLLNIGPKADGTFPAESINCLEEVGSWMKVNSEAIYGTIPSPFVSQLDWGRATRKEVDGKQFLYLHVFTQYWPKDGKLLVPDFGSGIKRAYLLIDAKKTSLPIDKMGDNHIFSLPLDAPDKISTTIVVETL